MSTLEVLIIDLIAIAVSEAILGALRTYLFALEIPEQVSSSPASLASASGERHSAYRT